MYKMKYKLALENDSIQKLFLRMNCLFYTLTGYEAVYRLFFNAFEN